MGNASNDATIEPLVEAVEATLKADVQVEVREYVFGDWGSLRTWQRFLTVGLRDK